MTAKRKTLDPHLDLRLPCPSSSPDERHIYEMRVSLLLADTAYCGDAPEDRRAAERATDALIKHYREASCRGRMQVLDIRVRFFCDDLKARNGGRLLAPKGGAPDKEHERFLVAFWINERIVELGHKRGNVEFALREAMARFGLGYESVRGTYYAALAEIDWPRQVEWQRVFEKAARGTLF